LANGGHCEDCEPCWHVYGDFLYLRPGNDKVAYALQINGAIVPPAGAPPVQVGPEAVVDNTFDFGFRVGFTRVLNECSNLGAAFTWFESDQANALAVNAPIVIRSLVAHPGLAAAPTDYLTADGTNHIGFRLADVDYRRFLLSDSSGSLNLLAGARYASLEQRFRSVFTNAVTTDNVNTDITFDGGGIRFGLEGNRQTECGLLIYAQGYASFLGGRFVSRYTQATSALGTVVSTGWDEDRVVSMLDAELGLGWTNASRRLRVTAGYTFSGWLNLISTDDFIRAVRTNNSVNVSDALTFDGLVARAEIRF
jgi:hypothetical protein